MQAFHDALIRDVSSEEGFPLPADLHVELQAFRGKPLDTSEDMVKKHFNGGEMVHAKVFDAEGNQWINAYSGGWTMK